MIKIADILQISLDELAGRTEDISEPKIRNSELMNLYHQVDQLPDNEQQALILVIDSFVHKAQLGKAMRALLSKKLIKNRLKSGVGFFLNG